jgi:hypothetical protein
MSTSNPGSSPVYSTDFENVTVLDANRLNLGIDARFYFEGEGGASMWMEGLDRKTPGFTCHSGTRCLGMELTNITKSRRNEFNIMHLENLVGDELFISVWLYLPAGWKLQPPNGDWYEIVNPYCTDVPSNLPCTAIQIFQTSPTPTFDMDLMQRDTSDNLTHLQNVANYPLPLGRWFNVQYYVYRNISNGAIKVWIDGALLYNVTGISTKNPSIAQWFTTPAKIYYGKSDTFSPYRMWVDDLEIYNTLPPATTSLAPPIPGFTWESILVGVIMGLGVLAVTRGRRKLPS